jgi:signal transduction histidine kinase
VRYISHELRTPLNIISLALQMLSENTNNGSTCGSVESLSRRNSFDEGEGWVERRRSRSRSQGQLDQAEHSSLDTAIPFHTPRGSPRGSLRRSFVGSVRQTQLDGVARDAQEACKAAMDTLNNLLLYDQVDDGSLRLRTSAELLGPLILDSVAMFAVQVRRGRPCMGTLNFMSCLRVYVYVFTCLCVCAVYSLLI